MVTPIQTLSGQLLGRELGEALVSLREHLERVLRGLRHHLEHLGA